MAQQAQSPTRRVHLRALPENSRPEPVARTVRIFTVVIIVVAGVLIGVTLSTYAGNEHRQAGSLPDLAHRESARVEQIQEEIDAKTAYLNELVASLETDNTRPQTPLAVRLAAGEETVSGPGVIVKLWDAPPDTTGDGVVPDDLVVHQQDLEGVLNALWAGGAEAIAVQGERIVSLSSLRCVGNVLLIGGRTYSPPYVIEAIGDPKRLREAVDASPQIQLYREYVRRVNLGWDFSADDDLTIAAYTGRSHVDYAHVLPED